MINNEKHALLCDSKQVPEITVSNLQRCQTLQTHSSSKMAEIDALRIDFLNF